MSTRELGATAYQKYDIEAWMPGRGSWGELASASNCTDFQARRLDIRHASISEAASRSMYAHTLNATAAAIPRLIVALIENGVSFDAEGKVGGIALPDVLKRYWIGPETFSISDKRAVQLIWR